MKTSLATIIAVCLSSFFGYSQMTNLGRMEGARVNTKPSADVPPNGSPYYDQTLRTVMVSGSATLVRHNSHTDQIEYLVGEETWVLTPQKNVLIPTSDKKYIYVYTDYAFGNKAEEGYLLLVKDLPNVKLYSKQRVTLSKEVISNGYTAYKPATYEKLPTKYLIKIKDNPIVQLTAKKKDLVKLFPGKEKEISAYLKNEKNLDENDRDMTKLAEFLNTLI